MIAIRAAVLLGLAASAATAQQVAPCDWQARADNIVEPWEAHSRTFSNGKVRLAMLDTIEPAAGWAWLLLLSPPLDELGARQCRVVGGFAGMAFDAMVASYDPAVGLIFDLPVRVMNAAGGFDDAQLTVTLNQASGAVAARLR